MPLKIGRQIFAAKNPTNYICDKNGLKLENENWKREERKQYCYNLSGSTVISNCKQYGMEILLRNLWISIKSNNLSWGLRRIRILSFLNQISIMNGVDKFERFVQLHRNQLQTSVVPEHFWKTLHEKLSHGVWVRLYFIFTHSSRSIFFLFWIDCKQKWSLMITIFNMNIIVMFH